MKKLSIFITILSLFPIQIWAQTDSKTADFLTRVNGYYYSLLREGAGHLRCLVTVTVPPEFVESMNKESPEQTYLFKFLNNVNYTVSCGPMDEVSVELISPPPKLDKKAQLIFDLVTGAWKIELQEFFNAWNRSVIGPIYPKESLSQRTLRVQNGMNGFQVVTNDKKRTAVLTFSFDRQVRLYDFTVNQGGVTVFSIKSQYLSSPKGFLLRSYTQTDTSGTVRCQIEYGIFRGYKVPKKVILTAQGLQKSSDIRTLYLSFSDFKLSQ